MKTAIIVSHLLAAGTWLFLRLTRPPIEGYILGNYYVLACVISLGGFIGPPLLRLDVFAALSLLSVPALYNLLRYQREYCRYRRMQGERRGILPSASPFNRQSVDVNCLFGVCVVIGAVVTRQSPVPWGALALFPAVVFAITLWALILPEKSRRG